MNRMVISPFGLGVRSWFQPVLSTGWFWLSTLTTNEDGEIDSLSIFFLKYLLSAGNALTLSTDRHGHQTLCHTLVYKTDGCSTLGCEGLKDPSIGVLDLVKFSRSLIVPRTAKGLSSKVSAMVRVLALCA